jgi:carboxyl-terminal processing protease
MRSSRLVLPRVLPLAVMLSGGTCLDGRAGAQTPAPPLAAATAAAAPTPADTFDAAWQILRRNYIAQTAGTVDWDRLREELRPRAERARTVDESRAVVSEMLSRIGRSHFAVLPAPVATALDMPDVRPEQTGTLGFDVGLVENQVLVTHVDPDSTASRAGVRTGWAVRRIGSRSVVADLEHVPGDLAPHVRAFRVWAASTALLRGRAGDSASIVFENASGHDVAVTLTRTADAGQTVKLGHLPTLFASLTSERLEREGRQVGVIRFNVWMTPVTREFDAAIDRLRDCDGIVVDLRGNPGGVVTMIMGVSGHFLAEPVTLGTIKTRDTELSLVANPRLVSSRGQAVQPFKGPLAIVVDASSYSASEIFAGGMQSIGRARIFGARTAGGALPAVLERLPGGDVLQYAIGDFVTAGGTRIEGRGVLPDEPSPVTRADLLAGRDPAVDAAVRWIAQTRK